MTTYTARPATMHSGHDIRDAQGSMVAIVHNPAADRIEGARIAALMAAAPGLLAALEDTKLWLESDDAGDKVVVAKINAAIARATGAAQ